MHIKYKLYCWAVPTALLFSFYYITSSKQKMLSIDIIFKIISTAVKCTFQPSQSLLTLHITIVFCVNGILCGLTRETDHLKLRSMHIIIGGLQLKHWCLFATKWTCSKNKQLPLTMQTLHMVLTVTKDPHFFMVEETILV